MNLQEMGELLRSERERKGLSLDEVIEKTKISRRNLEAIEQGKQEDLPHLVYARGFVKNYARLLGLDADQLGHALTQAIGDDEELSEEMDTVGNASVPLTVRPSVLRRVWGALILLAVLGMLGVGGYALLGTLSVLTTDLTARLAKEPGSEPTPQAADAPASLPSASAPTAPVTRPDPAISSVPVLQERPEIPAAIKPELPAATRSETAARPVPAVQPEQKSVLPEQKPAEADARERHVAGKEHVVEITARDACWLKAMTDEGPSSREYFLRVGESIRLPFTKVLMLKLGNAGGVSITYDGKPYQLTAQSGQVRTISFP